MNLTELWLALAEQLASRQATNPATLTVCIDTDVGPIEITDVDVLGSRLVLTARDMLSTSDPDKEDIREGLSDQRAELRDLAAALERAEVDSGYVDRLYDAIRSLEYS